MQATAWLLQGGCNTTSTHSLTKWHLQHVLPMRQWLSAGFAQDAMIFALLVGAFQMPMQQCRIQGTAPGHAPALPAWLPR